MDVGQSRNVVQLQVIVRVDQAGEHEVIAQIEPVRDGRGTPDAARGERQRHGVGAIVVHDARVLQHAVRPRSHGSLAVRKEREQTHRRQMAFGSTSRPSRHATALGELSTAERPPAECTLPSGGWKKHGRTVPSDSITLDTQGAKVFEGMGIYAPTLGIIGAVLGLMAVMRNLADPSQLGHGISAAFIATVYGIGAANMFLLPMASKLKALVAEKTRTREMLIEGLISISRGDNPRNIEAKLQGFFH